MTRAQKLHEESEELPRMGLGDHLDELRRRLLICLTTLFVCVGAMLPFKDQVVGIYMQPYRIMWAKAYEDFLHEIVAKHEAQPGPADPGERLAAAAFLTPQKVDEILRGDYPEPGEIATRGGFPGTYPARDSAAWPAFADAFRAYADSLRRNRDGTEQVEWHLLRPEILIGEYPEDLAHLIFSQGGFQLHYNLVALGGVEDFWIFMAASLLFSAMVAAPVLLWHMWAFIAAGLYKRERMMVYRALPFSLALLVGGVLFGYLVVVPYGFYFLAQLMNWAQVGPMFTVGLYFKFLLMLTFALALVFQLPVVMLGLQKIGLLQFETMRKNWRWVVLVIFVIAAILTPPDPVTQMLMAGPMVFLFLLGLYLMWRVERRQRVLTARAAAAAGSSESAQEPHP